MAKLTKKPKSAILTRAKQVLAASSVLVAVGCGDDDTTDAGMFVGLTVPDASPDVQPGPDAGVTAPDGGVDAPIAVDAGVKDAGNDVAPPPGLTPFDAG